MVMELTNTYLSMRQKLRTDLRRTWHIKALHMSQLSFTRIQNTSIHMYCS